MVYVSSYLNLEENKTTLDQWCVGTGGWEMGYTVRRHEKLFQAMEMF